MSLKSTAFVLLIFGALLFSVGFTIDQDYQEWEDNRDQLKSECLSMYTTWQSCSHIDNLENPNDSGGPYMNFGFGLIGVGMILLIYNEWDLT